MCCWSAGPLGFGGAGIPSLSPGRSVGAQCDATRRRPGSGRGGDGAAGALSSTEIYDPDAGTWTPGAALASSRTGHTANLLTGGLTGLLTGEGRVLVAGGTGDAGLLTNAEVFDASAGPAGAWTTTANMVRGHTDHTATALTDGRVLVVGNDFSFGAGPGDLRHQRHERRRGGDVDCRRRSRCTANPARRGAAC